MIKHRDSILKCLVLTILFRNFRSKMALQSVLLFKTEKNMELPPDPFSGNGIG